MKITQMRASFGRLKNAGLSLGPGLNIVQAPNESGKSTWCAFIRAMLYGVNTAERDKSGYLPDKTRFRPWDGGAMEGEMELTWGGKPVTLTRTAVGASPMKKLTAVYTGTAAPVPGIEGNDAGEKLTGMPEKVFERTAFIRQAGVRVSSDPELEKRISALVSAGDEQLSYSQADGLLRKWDRAIEYKKSGQLPKLRAELEENEALLGRLQTLAVTSARAAEQCRNFEKRVSCFEEQLAQLDAYDAYTEYLSAVKAADAADAARERADALRDRLTVEGHEITRAEIAALRDAYAAAAARRSACAEVAETETQTRSQLEAAAEKRDRSPFAPLPPEDALRRAASAESMETQLHKPVWRYFLLAAAAAAVVLAVVLATPAAYAAGAAAAVGCIAGFVAAGAKYRKNTARLHKLLNGFESAQALSRAAQDYASACSAADSASGVHTAAAAALRQADIAQQTAVVQLKQAMARVCPGARTGELQQILAQLDAASDGAAQARQEAAAAERISSSLGGRPQAAVPPAEKPEADRAAAERNLRDARARLTEAQKHMNLLQGELRACGDPVLIGTRIAQLNEQIETLDARHAALGLAVETLRQADAELQTRFSPVINREAAGIMDKLTAGKYTRLSFDAGFDADVAGAGDAAAHSALYLSGGTLDQLYLALRLAMCQVLPGGEEPCPIILDDALASFDDERTRSALEYLHQLAGRRQVILFTCHTREADWAKEYADVTVTKL